MFAEILTRGDLGISTLIAGLMPVVSPAGSLTVTAGATPTLLVSAYEEGDTAVGDGGVDKPFAVFTCSSGNGSIQAGRIATCSVSLSSSNAYMKDVFSFSLTCAVFYWR